MRVPRPRIGSASRWRLGGAVVVVAALLLVALHLVVHGGHPQQPATTGASGAGLRAAPAAADREVARTHPRGLRVVALGDSVTSGAACGRWAR